MDAGGIVYVINFDFKFFSKVLFKSLDVTVNTGFLLVHNHYF
jgi:hypothetical protein